MKLVFLILSIIFFAIAAFGSFLGLTTAKYEPVSIGLFFLALHFLPWDTWIVRRA